MALCGPVRPTYCARACVRNQQMPQFGILMLYRLSNSGRLASPRSRLLLVQSGSSVGRSVYSERRAMATKLEAAPPPTQGEQSELQKLARRHLWMHFTRMGAYE